MPCRALTDPALRCLDCLALPDRASPGPAVPGRAKTGLPCPDLPRPARPCLDCRALPRRALPRLAVTRLSCHATPGLISPRQNPPGHASTALPCHALPGLSSPSQAEPRRPSHHAASHSYGLTGPVGPSSITSKSCPGAGLSEEGATASAGGSAGLDPRLGVPPMAGVGRSPVKVASDPTGGPRRSVSPEGVSLPTKM